MKVADPLDIPLRQLEYLVAVADHPTWSSAATSLGVSASALSQGLADLERRLGVQLFERQGRRRVLTDLANPVLQHARTVHPEANGYRYEDSNGGYDTIYQALT